MTNQISISPDILRWARESVHLTVEDVVTKFKRKKVTGKTIEAWESGTDTPSYIQLERLAYEIYKRPLAVFFFPEPPIEEPPENTFRTLPGFITNNLSSRIHFLLRKAKAMQINLQELFNGINPSHDLMQNDFEFSLETNITLAARSVREYLGISVSDQRKIKSNEEALKIWRSAVEDKGVFVFKDAFRNDDISGFCLYDSDFPIIYINNSTSKTRQMFTLFHEVAHILFKTGGIDKIDDSFIHFLKEPNREIEILCNRFAGELLVPSSSFENKIKNKKIDRKIINHLSNYYHVSPEVILRKLIDRDLITQGFYENVVDEQNEIFFSKSVEGGNYYNNQYAYLSKRYLGEAFKQYFRQNISSQQLAEYLNVKEKSIAGIEQIFINAG